MLQAQSEDSESYSTGSSGQASPAAQHMSPPPIMTPLSGPLVTVSYPAGHQLINTQGNDEPMTLEEQLQTFMQMIGKGGM